MAANIAPAAPNNFPVANIANALPNMIMGEWEETYPGSGDFNALMGGQPLADWTGLDAAVPREEAVTSFHYRPVNPARGTKGHITRTQGLVTKFKRGDDLSIFQRQVWSHLQRHGMDTIAYLQNPFDNTLVVNVVENHARFSKDPAVVIASAQVMSDNFDRFDKQNDSNAKAFLLDSLDETLLERVELLRQPTDTFTIIWLRFIHHFMTTSIDRFDKIKYKIRMMSPRSYPGQDIERMTMDYTKLCKELKAAGFFDHNLTLSIVNGLLQADTGEQTYSFKLLQIHSRLTVELPAVAFMDKAAADLHMAQVNLTYDDVCLAASTTYRTLLDNNSWSPARLPGRQRGPYSRGNANINLTEDSSNGKPQEMFTAAEVMNLIQSKSYDGARKKELACFGCGGNHMIKDCPEKKKKNGGWINHKKRGNHSGGDDKKWQRVAPKEGESSTKEVKGRTFNFCKKCNRWTTTHTTDTHKSKSDNLNNQGGHNTGQSALAMEWSPALWCVEHRFDGPLMSKGRKQPIDQPTDHPTKNFGVPGWSWLQLFQVTYLVTSLCFLLWNTSTHIDVWSVSTNLASSMWSMYKSVLPKLDKFMLVISKLNVMIAPCLYFIAGYTAKSLELQRMKFQCRPASNQEIIESRRPSRKQRRYNKHNGTIAKQSMKHTWSKSKAKLKRTLPLHLRNNQQFDYDDYITPNLSQREFDLRFNDWFNKGHMESMNHQQRKHKYKHHTKAGRFKFGNKKHPSDRCYRCVQHNHKRTKCPNITYRQAIAVNKIANHVLLTKVGDDKEKAVLTAPQRFHEAIGKDKSFPLIWDSGASVSVTFDRKDFVTFQSISTTVDGVCSKKNKVEGKGEVVWCVHDSKGGIRYLRLEAFYIPTSRSRLIGTQGLLAKYSDEEIKIRDGRLVLSGSDNDTERGQVNVPINPNNNLPTSLGLQRQALEVGICELNTAISVTNDRNDNLSEAEKELIRWHCRLGHIGIRRIQGLMRTGILAHSEGTRRLHAAACKGKRTHPYCASCLFGKQSVRPSPGTRISTVRDRRGVIKNDNLRPGQEISVDHFICSTKGRLFSGLGKSADHKLYSGGCLFVDHATNYVHVEFQQSMSSHATLKGKTDFEAKCRDFGILPQKYLSDNGGAFTSKDFAEHLSIFNQTIRYAGVGAHHHNGHAERHIRTIMSIARTMMLHSAIHWSKVADSCLWPMAVNQAVYIWNHMPDERHGLSPHDLFTKSRWPHSKFHDIHVWGCPIYVLDKTIADGKKIPKWEKRSARGMYMGMSPKHASSVPLVLNLETGSITPQFHVVFDDWFATISTDEDALPDFNSDEWLKMFGDSAYQYMIDEDDDEAMNTINDVPDLGHQTRVTSAFDQVLPSVPLPIPVPVASGPIPNGPAMSPSAVPRGDENNNNRNLALGQHLTPSVLPTPAIPVQPIIMPSDAPTPIPIHQAPSIVPTLPNPVTPNTLTPSNVRRSLRVRKQPRRLNVESTSGKAYEANPDPNAYEAMSLACHFASIFNYPLDPTPQSPSIFKAGKSKSNPDIFSFDEAMNDGDMVSAWMQSMQKEISELEAKDVWDVVPISEPQDKGEQVVPSTWTLRYKRAPDGTIKKHKARFCVRGDLQQVDEESYSPVVAFTTVRLFLIIAMTLGWSTCSIDYSNAFVQAILKKPMYIHLPRGFHAGVQHQHQKCCLKLKRSLYGSIFAPKLWYKHLFKFLIDVEGFTPSKYDPCLLYKNDIMLINYTDDTGIAYQNEVALKEFLDSLAKNGFEYTKEGSFTEYLGIQYVKDKSNGKITMSQSGLIKKIIATAGMEDCNPNHTPAMKEALGKDPEGESMEDDWNYRSIVGMLLYLSNNTRPDIMFAVSQVARFSYAPKKSHATAVKTIVRYLAGSKERGTIFEQPKDLNLKCYVDADFCGLFNKDPPEDPSSAKSRTGYIISVGGCYLVAKSQLQTTIALSTSESEYYALSQAMRALLPIHSLILEVIKSVAVPKHLINENNKIKVTLYEDNSSALILATGHHVTSRTRHYAVKWHFFWSHVKTRDNPDGSVELEKIATDKQQADYMTKGMVRESFQNCRRLNQGW